jgi:cold shock CspA family protein
VHGTMMWFNRQKGFGVIQTEAGRIRVDSDGFEAGELPEGRCAGQHVTLDCVGDGDEGRAVGVRFVAAADPRRARMRSARGSARAI